MVHPFKDYEAPSGKEALRWDYFESLDYKLKSLHATMELLSDSLAGQINERNTIDNILNGRENISKGNTISIEYDASECRNIRHSIRSIGSTWQHSYGCRSKGQPGEIWIVGTD